MYHTVQYKLKLFYFSDVGDGMGSYMSGNSGSGSGGSVATSSSIQTVATATKSSFYEQRKRATHLTR